MKFQFKLLFLFMLLFVFSALLIFVSYSKIKKEISESVQQDLENIIHSVHYSSRKLSNEKMPDQLFLNTFIDSLKHSPNVQEINIVGNNNEIVASSNPRKIGKHQLVNDQIVVVRESYAKVNKIREHDRYQITIPIEREKKIVGLVQTSIVVNNMDSLMDDLFVKNALVTISSLLLLYIIFYEAFRRLNRPVSLLVKASARIADGEKFVPIAYKKKGELSSLINSFNLMAQKIEAQRSIEEQHRELERRAILSETAATLAHEIRNPLNCINLSVDLLIDSSTNESDKEVLVSVKKEVQRLNKMVTDFLSMGKPMPIVKSWFELQDLINEVTVLMKRHLTDKSVTLEINIPDELEIYADREQMRLVLLNLLLNSIQAIGKNGHISMQAYRSKESATITVTDNGPGIPEDDLQKIFEPYFTTKADGAGLGLALVKRIIEEHSGKIIANQSALHGASFEICIPIERKKNG